MRNISENAEGNYPRVNSIMGFPAGTGGKEPTYQRKRQKKHGFNPWIGKTPWRRACLQTLVFLLEESHGQRSLMCSISKGHKESDRSKAT